MDPKSLRTAAAATPLPPCQPPAGPSGAPTPGNVTSPPAAAAGAGPLVPHFGKNEGRGRLLNTLAQQVATMPAKINRQFQKHKPILSSAARSLVCDRKQLAKHPMLGIPMAHVAILERYAAQGMNDCVIGIRPVGPLARSLIEAGYPAKPLEVKAKSSDIGPIWGFIPVDPMYSKSRRAILRERREAAGSGQAGLTPAEKKAAAQIKACTGAGKAPASELPVACKVPLRISNARFLELEQAGVFASKKLEDGEFLLTTKVDRVRLQFRARKDGDAYRIFDAAYNPIEVLAPMPKDGSEPTEAIKPFVPDYDLLAVGVNLAQFGADDNCSLSSGQGGDPHLGIVSKRIRKIVDELGRPQYFGRSVVQHGADTQNPASDPDSNYPALFILPKPMRGVRQYRNVRLETAVLVPSIEAHRVVQQICHDNNYNLPAHAAWSRLTKVRAASFESAKSKLESRRQSWENKVHLARTLQSFDIDDDEGGPSKTPLSAKVSLESLPRSHGSSPRSLLSRSRRSSKDGASMYLESLEASAEESRRAMKETNAGTHADGDAKPDQPGGAGQSHPTEASYLTDIIEERSGVESGSDSSHGGNGT